MELVFGWFIILAVIAGFTALCVVISRAGLEANRHKRRQEIKRAMELGLADERLRQEIAEEIIRERGL